MGDQNDVTDKSAMGVFTIIIAIVILLAFIIFLVLNLRHWKTQTYKIRVTINHGNFIDNSKLHNLPFLKPTTISKNCTINLVLSGGL